MVHGDEKSMETMEGLFTDLETPKRFSPQQLQTFTAGFSTSLGSGAFGDVFKGVLHDGVQVAVKVLKGGILSDGVNDQFKAEVSVLGKIHHKHVVRLYGFCFEQNMKALVYEFMENKSLEKQLYGNQTIAWVTLCNIAVGVAKGLAYLHEDCQPSILHYDVKPANILLDSKFSPKVGDFGLAKRLNLETTHITESRIRGTSNYMAPELLMRNSWITHKCDVFSFGISLFDIIGRRKHVQGEGEKWFPVQVWKKFKEEKQEEIMHECRIQETDRKQAKRILLIALQCVQFSPGDRPSMSRVVRLLEGTEEVKLSPNPFLMHMGSSSEVTESVRQENKEDNISRTTLGPSMNDGKDGTVVGLHGREGGGLDAIHMEYNKDHQEKLKENDEANVALTRQRIVGPWGGDGGYKWDDRVFPGIKKIEIGIRGDVRSIRICYCGSDGDPIWSERHGFKDTHTTDTIELDYPREYLVRVTGFHDYEFGDKVKGYHLVRSLCFFSNKKKYGPFGEEKGSYFSTKEDGKDGKVIGFHGRAGFYLDAIGMHMEYNKDHQEKFKENDEDNVAHIKSTIVGPWGGDGGYKWDDRVSPGIKKIEIYKGIKGDVRSMQICYCINDGDPIWSERHGYKDTHTTDTIVLDYPSEYLVRVTGFHDYEFGDKGYHLVRSLTFFSNKKKYGPFGEEKGSYFSTRKDGKDGKVIGFHGRSGIYLDAIGMHMEYSS